MSIQVLMCKLCQLLSETSHLSEKCNIKHETFVQMKWLQNLRRYTGRSLRLCKELDYPLSEIYH